MQRNWNKFTKQNIVVVVVGKYFGKLVPGASVPSIYKRLVSDTD